MSFVQKMQSRVIKSSLNIRPKTTGDQKNISIFHQFYTEQCKQKNLKPLINQKIPNELDLITDKITPEEWIPVLNALRFDTSLTVLAIRSRVQYKFLHDIDNEVKARHMKRRIGSLFTPYILKLVLKTLSNCLIQNKSLNSLELEGVPINFENIDILLEGLKKNTTLKTLILKNCTLRDLGCKILSKALFESNIETLNLTLCSLGATSTQYLAEILKFQKANKKIQKIVLNNNPNIGDEGLVYLLEELSFKSLEMQRCGITDNMGMILVDTIVNCKNLMVADFRYNELSPKILHELGNIIKSRSGNEANYYKAISVGSTLGTILENPNKNNLSRTKTFCSITKPKICNNQNCSKTSATLNKPTILKPTLKQDIQKSSIENIDKLKEAITIERSMRVQKEVENKKLKEELARIKSTLAAKVVKFNPMPVNEVKIKTKSKSKVVKKPTRVEFIFENNKNKIADVLKSMLVKNKTHEDEIYYRSLQQVTKDEPKENSSNSNSSLIEYMREVKNEIAIRHNSCSLNKYS